MQFSGVAFAQSRPTIVVVVPDGPDVGDFRGGGGDVELLEAERGGLRESFWADHDLG